MPHGPAAVHRITAGTTDIGPGVRTGGDAGLNILDEHIWNTFREHLVLKPEPIASELVQPTLVLHRQRQEGETRPIPFDPLYPAHITWHGGGTAPRVHHERQVLSGLEGFREAEATPPRCHINH
jgi:hypothetical protein